MDRFEIDQIFPLSYDDMWGAKITISTPETINEAAFGQNATLTVRFVYPDDGPASGLLEAAIRKAEECLASSKSFIAGKSAKDILSAVKAERDAREAEWNKPLEFPPLKFGD